MAPAPSRLLALPGELKNRIYRLALVSSDVIGTSAAHFVEPALLKVSKEIRAETGSIYYGENKFGLDCTDWEPTLVLLWDKKKIKVKKDFRITVQTRFRSYYATVPSWLNLLRWLKHVHSRDTDSTYKLPSNHAPGVGTGGTPPLEGHIVAGLFILAIKLRGMAWKEVEGMFEHQHVALAALNQAWL